MSGASGKAGTAGALMGAGGAVAGGSGGRAGAGAGGSGGRGGGGGSKPCVPGVGVFCDDFESGEPGEGWASVEQNGFGTALSVVERGAQLGRVLRASAKATNDTDERGALLRQSFGQATTMRCEVEIFVEQQREEELDLMTFTFLVPGFSSYEVNFGLLDDEARLENFRTDNEGVDSYPNEAAGALPKGEWLRVALEIDPTEARLFYNETEMTSLPLDLSKVAGSSFALGITWLEDSDDVAVRFDNLACTFRAGAP